MALPLHSSRTMNGTITSEKSAHIGEYVLGNDGKAAALIFGRWKGLSYELHRKVYGRPLWVVVLTPLLAILVLLSFLIPSLSGACADNWSSRSPNVHTAGVHVPQRLNATLGPTKAVILASYEGQKLEWLKAVPEDWQIHRVLTDGREAYAYLSWIIENYEDLPDYMIFLHGHARSWHQIEPASWKIRALSLDSLAHEGYINLRCSTDSGCSDDTLIGSAHPWIGFGPLRDILGNMMTKFWASYLTPHGFGPMPEHIGQPCCSQFAVTRQAVQLRSRDFYFTYRSPLEWTVAKGRAIFGFNWDDYHSGTIYEYLWHVIFGKESFLCPHEDKCREVYFSDAMACDSIPGRYQTSFGWKEINCTSAYQQEQFDDSISRVSVTEWWPAGRDKSRWIKEH